MSVCGESAASELGVSPYYVENIVDNFKFKSFADYARIFKEEHAQRIFLEAADGIRKTRVDIAEQGILTFIRGSTGNVFEQAKGIYQGSNALKAGSQESASVHMGVRMNRLDNDIINEAGTTGARMRTVISDPKSNYQFAQEMYVPGSSGSAEMATLAKVMQQKQLLHANQINSHGGFVMFPDNGVATLQYHNPSKIGAVTKKEYIDDVMGWQEGTTGNKLDRGGIAQLYDDFTHPLKGLSDAGLETIPHHSGKNVIKTISQRSLEPIKYVNADAWVKYHAKYGEGEAIRSAIWGLRAQARAVGLVEKLGPNPLGYHKVLKKGLKERLGDGFTPKHEEELDFIFDMLVDHKPTSVVPKIESIVNNILNLNFLSKMGFSSLTALGDISQASLNLGFQGIPIFKTYYEMLKNIIFQNSKDETIRVFRLMGGGADGVFTAGTGRFQLGDNQPGVLSNWASSYANMIGLSQLTTRMRTAHVKMASAHMADMATDHSWTSLSSRYRKVLERYGIKEDDWAVIRSDGVTRIDEMPSVIENGKALNYIPDERYVLPDALLSKNPKNGKYRRLADRLNYFYHDEARFAVPEAGLQEKTWMHFGHYQGTAMGQALRLFWEFRTPQVRMWSHLAPRINEMGPGFLLHTLPFLGVGYGVLSIKDFFKGRGPRDPLSFETFLDSLAQTGFAVFAFDALSAVHEKGFEDMDKSFLGTTYSTVKDWATVSGSAMKGERWGIDLYNLIKANTPFMNIFYTELLLTSTIHDSLKEMIDPGYIRRRNAWLSTKGQSQFSFVN
jgi:hypothetical protein